MSVNVSENSLNTNNSTIAHSLQAFTGLDIGHNAFNTNTFTHSSSFNYSYDNLRINTNNSRIEDGQPTADCHIGGKNTKFLNTSLDTGNYIRAYPNDELQREYQLNNYTPGITPQAAAANTITPQKAASILPPTSNSSNQPLAPSITPLSSGNTNILKGTLRADTFTYQPGYSRTVIYGNGNVDFGSGALDTLDLGKFNSNAVSINLANTSTGGVVYNPGNGNTLFDAITLSDGSQILFEGIEAIKFADTTITNNLSVTPNDPLFNQQWNLHIMGVQDAWRFTQGSNKVLIGIDDTGLGTNSSGQINPDLRSTTFIGNNYLDPSPAFSHGTMVEGVIAAASNNGTGISGINWNSDVFLIDVVGDQPGVYNLANATQAMINQANSKGQRLVVNLSFSGGDSPAFDQLIANNQDKALFVIASGNDDKNSLASPADLAKKYSNVVAVGASWGTKDWYGNPKTPGDRISYSNWWGSNYGDGLTLVAPSEYITTSATRVNANSPYTFGNESKFNGTSAAAPNVTGVASLVWSVAPNLTATQIRSILSETAVDLGAPGYDQVYGNGFVNADAAVRRALAIAKGYA